LDEIIRNKCYWCGIEESGSQPKRFYRQIVDESHLSGTKMTTTFHYTYCGIDVPTMCLECQDFKRRLERPDFIPLALQVFSLIGIVFSFVIFAQWDVPRVVLLVVSALFFLGASLAAFFRRQRKLKAYEQDHHRKWEMAHPESLKEWMTLVKEGWIEGEPPTK
jgi:hypothetical protein